ncbi:5-carboxymethyl-2-hydroxymuconate Delta-isomerase [Photobacterium makurazakiensis]|uniref:5-carboxymethyl-2-hydroxymuconate Delta-isomerase n=1 Tax=Photobacterium makurazakiensis TaxID=2910234 RepID=UPI003D0D2246
MPHCIIEYSQNIESQTSPFSLVNAVSEGASLSGLFDGPDIKTRAIPYQYYQVGSEQSDFVHVSVRILCGRDHEQKAHLSDHVLKGLVALGLTDVSLTVEIIDIDKDTYSKCLL